MELQFKIGQEVFSKSKYSKDKKGVVWKISDYGVHVKFLNENRKMTESEYLFQVYHFNPTHHKQSPISELTTNHL